MSRSLPGLLRIRLSVSGVIGLIIWEIHYILNSNLYKKLNMQKKGLNEYNDIFSDSEEEIKAK